MNYRKIFCNLKKNCLLCTLFCGSSCKVAEKDALRHDMRTEMAATKRPVKLLI